MDFGDILDQWDIIKDLPDKGQKEKARKKQNPMTSWLDKYPPKRNTGDGGSPGGRKNTPPISRDRLRKMAPQATLDLHGFTVEEAVKKLERFVNQQVKQGRRKILIIHGKGNHSEDGAVIKPAVLRFLERCPKAGEFGSPGRELGGSGATWVILR